MILSVNYHYIRENFDAPYPSIFGVTPEQFSRQLDLLSRTACFLSISDIIDIIDGKRSYPERAAVITFDDGLKEQYKIAWPILQAKGIPAIFFVNTKPIEDDFVTTTHKIHILRSNTSPEKFLTTMKEIHKKEGLVFKLPELNNATSVYIYDEPHAAQVKYYLNYVLDKKQKEIVVDKCFEKLGFDQIKKSRELYMTKQMVVDLSYSDVIGSHGHSHLPFGLLDKADAIRDFDTSINKLMSWTGNSIRAFSYPFGSKEACCKTIANYAQAKKIRFAFSMERAVNKRIDVPMFMARFSSNDIFGKNCKFDNNLWDEMSHAKWFRNRRENE